MNDLGSSVQRDGALAVIMASLGGCAGWWNANARREKAGCYEV